MSKRILNRWFLTALVAVCATFSAFGQAAGTYTPYSIYGVGDLSQPGSAYNKTMGGVGVALRNNRYINLLNPAAVTARDSLAFMADFSLYNDNKVFNQGGIKSASNTFNINNLVMSFPIWRSSAMMVGIMPYSDTGFGYSFEYTDPDLIGYTGNINYSATGKGSIYKAFAAAGVTFFKRLSLGVQWNTYFGKVEKNFYTEFKDASYNSIRNGTTGQITGNNFKFGLQFQQPLGTKHALTVGATYSTAATLRGTMASPSASPAVPPRPTPSTTRWTTSALTARCSSPARSPSASPSRSGAAGPPPSTIPAPTGATAAWTAPADSRPARSSPPPRPRPSAPASRSSRTATTSATT